MELRKWVSLLIMVCLFSVGQMFPRHHQYWRYPTALRYGPGHPFRGHHALSSNRKYASRARLAARAAVSPPRLTVRQETVEGSADVTDPSPASTRYSCTWTERHSTGAERSVAGNVTLYSDPNDTRNTQDHRGRCSFSTALPRVAGNYTYTVTLSPGDTTSTSQPVTVGINMESCPLAAPENATRVVTCTRASSTDSVYWWYRPRGGNFSTAGQCDPLPDGCWSRNPSIMRLARPSVAVSIMTLARVSRASLGGATIQCLAITYADWRASDDSCEMDVISPAVISPQRVTLSPAQNIVQGLVLVVRVFSSLGRYSCQWTERSPSGSVRIVSSVLSLTPSPDHISNTQDRSGRCSFSTALPRVAGNYTYTVTVSPGHVTSFSQLVTVGFPRLRPCSNDVKAVERNTFSYFKCDNYFDDVTWYYKRPQEAERTLGTCSRSGCHYIRGLPHGLSLVWNSPVSSSLLLAATASGHRLTVTYRCADRKGSDSCRVELFTPAAVNRPYVSAFRGEGRIDAGIFISRIYSSMGRYSCQWIERSSNGTVRTLPSVLRLKPPPDDLTKTSDRMGVCRTGHNTAGVSDEGNNVYTYSVTVNPGRTRWTNDQNPININMEPCPVLAVENIPLVVTCDGISERSHVGWSWKRGRGPNHRYVGECRSGRVACAVTDPAQNVTLSRPSYDVTTMTFPPVTRSRFSDVFVRCHVFGSPLRVGMNDECPVDVVVPAVVAPPQIVVVVSSRRITGSAGVTRVYSSRGRYSCQWTERSANGTERSLPEHLYLFPDAGFSRSTEDRHGHCSFSTTLPRVAGRYTYTVTVSPGDTTSTSSKVVTVPQ